MGRGPVILAFAALVLATAAISQPPLAAAADTSDGDAVDVQPGRETPVGSAPAVRPVDLPPSSAAAAVPAPVPLPDSFGALARSYQARAQSDPANVQAWTLCAAVAQKRSVADPAEAEAYARQSATVLQLIAVDRKTSPCPDAIPQTLWDGGPPDATADASVTAAAIAQAAEEARSRELNARADARARAEAERRAAERAAYDRQVAAAAVARASYAREQAAYWDAKGRADAAAADYARQMERYRRGGGDRVTPQ